VSYTLAFALQLRKKHGKTSVRVAKTSIRVAGQKYLENFRNVVLEKDGEDQLDRSCEKMKTYNVES
jgi:hypothetical protein